MYPAMAKQVSCSGRREEVLRGMWAGKGVKEIGGDLGISPKTVEYHRAKLYQVFRVQDPVSLCRRALHVGLIRLDGVEPVVGRRKARGGAAVHAN